MFNGHILKDSLCSESAWKNYLSSYSKVTTANSEPRGRAMINLRWKLSSTFWETSKLNVMSVTMATWCWVCRHDEEGCLLGGAHAQEEKEWAQVWGGVGKSKREWKRVKSGLKRTSWRRRRLRAPPHCLGVIGGGGIVARWRRERGIVPAGNWLKRPKWCLL